MNLYRSLSLVLTASALALAGCGSSTIGGGGGDGGNGAGGNGAGGNGAGGGSTDPNLCNGQPNPESCADDAACPAGMKCVVDADPTNCHPSGCSCDAATNSWVCTADCGMGGSSCVAAAPTCNGAPSPVSCADVGCPAGFVCTPDPNPMTCHPSTCSCDAATNTWVCTEDCMMNGSTCVQGM